MWVLHIDKQLPKIKLLEMKVGGLSCKINLREVLVRPPVLKITCYFVLLCGPLLWFSSTGEGQPTGPNIIGEGQPTGPNIIVAVIVPLTLLFLCTIGIVFIAGFLCLLKHFTKVTPESQTKGSHSQLRTDRKRELDEDLSVTRELDEDVSLISLNLCGNPHILI